MEAISTTVRNKIPGMNILDKDFEEYLVEIMLLLTVCAEEFQNNTLWDARLMAKINSNHVPNHVLRN